MRAWAARDKEGQLCFFAEVPTRGPKKADNGPFMWESDSEAVEWHLEDPIPTHSWEDPPIPVEITIRRS